MIKYSLLDIPSVPDDILVENVTIRLEEGTFDKTIITFDPIRLSDDGLTVSYGIVVRSLIINGIDQVDEDGVVKELHEVIPESQLNKLHEQIDETFYHVLLLMKDNIQFGETN